MESKKMQAESSNTHLSSARATGEDKAIDAKLRSINPAFKYLGFSLLLAYHYMLWFVPNSFCNTQLLSTSVTTLWIYNLIATAVTMMAAAIFLGRKRHLTDYRWPTFVLPFALAVVTPILEFLPGMVDDGLPMIVLAIVAGAIEGLVWILWGEYLTRARSRFSIIHIGTLFGAILFLGMIVAYLLPDILTPIFVTLMPMASGVLLVSCSQDTVAQDYPTLLPRETSKKITTNIVIVCLIGFVTGAACYFLAAIIPWEILPMQQESFSLGIITGSIVLLAFSGICAISKDRINILKIFPYLLVSAIVALSLFLADEALDLTAFLISLSISSLLEISLIMYFGTLLQRGFFSPAFGFALSVASIRLGICAGNSLALFYEANPALAQAFTPETALMFICVLAIALVPMSKRESAILALTNAPSSPNETNVICRQIAAEFGLSEREHEILKLLARGNTANSIGEKLVISPHTVNTHIRHIYEKVGIHKRSELLEYINMRRTDDQ